jgi:hypothetical protein
MRRLSLVNAPPCYQSQGQPDCIIGEPVISHMQGFVIFQIFDFRHKRIKVRWRLGYVYIHMTDIAYLEIVL